MRVRIPGRGGSARVDPGEAPPAIGSPSPEAAADVGDAVAGGDRVHDRRVIEHAGPGARQGEDMPRGGRGRPGIEHRHRVRGLAAVDPGADRPTRQHGAIADGQGQDRRVEVRDLEGGGLARAVDGREAVPATPPTVRKSPATYTVVPSTASAQLVTTPDPSTAPSPERGAPPSVSKSPATYSTPSWRASAATDPADGSGPSCAEGVQDGSSDPSARTCARCTRGRPLTWTKSPPMNQPPTPSATAARTEPSTLGKVAASSPVTASTGAPPPVIGPIRVNVPPT